MRTSAYFILSLLLLSSCKVKDCEDQDVPYKLGITQGTVQYLTHLDLPLHHAVVGNEVYAEVEAEIGDADVYDYSNPKWQFNGEVYTTESFSQIVTEPGEFELSYEADCTRKYEHKRECDCLAKERTASVDITVHDTVVLEISEINYHPRKGCAYDFPGNGCPDVYMSLPQFGLRSTTLWNYDIDVTGPLVWDSVLRVAIVPEFFTLKMKVWDDEFAGNHDIVDDVEFTPEMMNNWQSGTYQTNAGIDFTVTLIEKN